MCQRTATGGSHTLLGICHQDLSVQGCNQMHDGVLTLCLFECVLIVLQLFCDRTLLQNCVLEYFYRLLKQAYFVLLLKFIMKTPLSTSYDYINDNVKFPQYRCIYHIIHISAFFLRSQIILLFNHLLLWIFFLLCSLTEYYRK
jgi:hypothetical protein